MARVQPRWNKIYGNVTTTGQIGNEIRLHSDCKASSRSDPIPTATCNGIFRTYSKFIEYVGNIYIHAVQDSGYKDCICSMRKQLTITLRNSLVIVKG